MFNSKPKNLTNPSQNTSLNSSLNSSQVNKSTAPIYPKFNFKFDPNSVAKTIALTTP